MNAPLETIATPYGPRTVATRNGSTVTCTDGSTWQADGAAWRAIPSTPATRQPTVLAELLRDGTERALAAAEVVS